MPVDSPSVDRPRWPHRRRLGVTVVLVAALVGAVVAWWGRPRLAPGPSVAPGTGMTWAGDGFDNTRLVVRGRSVSTAAATLSITNEGNLPFTVHGLDTTDMTAWLADQQVRFVPGIPDHAPGTTGSKTVTIAPGEHATVLWTLDLACRPPLQAGSTVSIRVLPIEVTWLGIISTTRELALKQPITFAGDDVSRPLPGSDCARD